MSNAIGYVSPWSERTGYTNRTFGRPAGPGRLLQSCERRRRLRLLSPLAPGFHPESSVGFQGYHMKSLLRRP